MSTITWIAVAIVDDADYARELAERIVEQGKKDGKVLGHDLGIGVGSDLPDAQKQVAET